MMKKILSSLLLSLAGTTVLAISPADMQALHPNDQLQWKDENQQQISIRITQINQFKESDGSVWFRANGSTVDGKNYSWLLDPSGKGDIDLITDQMKLKEAGLTKKDIYQADKAGKGSVTYDGVEYDFQPEDSDDVLYQENPGDEPDEVSYFNFVSKQDDDDGLMVIEWDDDKFELFETESHELSELNRIPAP